jgi:predicted MPP superfamily phosphohydrolase
MLRGKLGPTLWLNGILAIADLVLAPLHAGGWGQSLLGYIIGFAHTLGLPGHTVSSLAGLRPSHRWTWPAFWAGLAVNLVFWFAVALIVERVRRRLRASAVAPGPTPHDAGSADAQISRRNWLLGGGRAVAGAGIGVGAWGFFGEARWFEVTRTTVPVKGLSPGLDGLRIVQLSDIHYGSWMSIAWVRQIIDATEALAPDVVALTGDYVYRGLEYVRPVARELARLKPRVGVVAVMGNHDWWEGGGEVTRQAFKEEGVPLIDNDRVFVTPNRRLVSHAREGLCLAGVGDLWEDKCLYDRALGGVPGGMPRVLLSHNPDVAEEREFLQGGYRVDLMLSGHTHGGQIRLPGVGSPVTNSAFGQKYAAGLVRGPVCPVYVSRGLGMTVMPVRLGVRPEIAVIELRVG